MTRMHQGTTTRVIRVVADISGSKRLLEAMGGLPQIFAKDYAKRVAQVYDAAQSAPTVPKKQAVILGGLAEIIGEPEHRSKWEQEIRMFYVHAAKNPALMRQLEATCAKLTKLAWYARTDCTQQLNEYGLEYLKQYIPVPQEF